MHCDRHSVCSIIRAKDVNKLAENLLQELNLLIDEVMDVATRKRRSMKCVPGFTNNSNNITNHDQLKLTKRRRHSSSKLSGISIPANGVLDNKQIKDCSVAVQQITDDDLKKYLAAEVYTKFIENGKHSFVKPFAIPSIMTIKSATDLKAKVKVNSNIDSKVMATEDQLDILMAKEMRFSKIRMEQRLRNSTPVNKLNTSNSNKMKNPLVILERLSSQFISHAVKGKPGEDKECEESTKIRRNNISPKPRKIVATDKKKMSTDRISSFSCCFSEWTATPGLRRSKRLSSCSYRHSAISVPSSVRHSSLCNKNKSYSRRQYLDSDILGNEENIPRQKRKMAPRKFIFSDDEDDFLGFEFPEKNKRKTYKLKKALRKLSAYTKKGQENENNKIVKEGSQNHSRQSAPLKAINRIEKTFIAPDERISIFADERMFREKPFSDLSLRACGRSFGDDLSKEHKFGDNYMDDKTINKLEILRLFKEREKTKLLMDNVLQGQRPNLRTRKFVNGKCYYRPVDYYNSDHYIVQTGKQIPLWSEENVRIAIMSYQEKIPVDLIASYFHNPQPLTLSGLFGSPAKGSVVH